MKLSAKLSYLTAILFLVTGCNANPDNTAITANNMANNRENSSEAQVSSLKIAATPHQKNATQGQKLDQLASYLQQQLGIPVNIQLSPNYHTTINLISTKQIAMAYMGASSYVEAKAKNPNLEAILAPIDKVTGRPWYTSVIVANTSKGIKTINDLSGKKFSFVDQSSTSGYLMAKIHFQKLAINTNTYFSQTLYAGTHDQNVANLISGKIDAIATDKQTYLRQQQLGKLPVNQYRIIWESDPIPNPPIVIATDQLPPLFITQLKQALINAPAGLVEVTGSESIGYTLVSDEDYEPIRKMRQILK